MSKRIWVGTSSFIASVFWAFGAIDVLADEAPSVGLLHNTKETHSMVYRCQQNHDKSLDCEFTQVMLRKKAKPEELDSKLKQARDGFRNEKKLSTDECKSYKDAVEILEGRKKPPIENSLKDMNDIQKRDALKGMKAIVEYCKSKTEENFLNVVRIGHEKDTRTCLVASNTFKQSFRIVNDTISGSRTWVTEGSPEGPCGIVQLSRFESEKMKDSKFSFWRYVAKKAITNPQGTFIPGVMSCKDFDEGEYVYDWRSKEHPLGCDYIEFSAL